MDPDFTIKRNDTASNIQATLENSGGTAVDIQSSTVLFKMAPLAGGTLAVAGTAVIDQVGAGTVVGGQMGVVHYVWQAGDLDTAGRYAAEWEVTFSSGAVQTFPNGDPIILDVNEDL